MAVVPFEQKQSLREVTSRLTSLPAGSVAVAAPPSAARRRVTVPGTLGEVLAASEQIRDQLALRVVEHTGEQIQSGMTIESLEAKARAAELQSQIEEAEDEREQRKADRELRREQARIERQQMIQAMSGGGMAQVLERLQGGSSDQLTALREELRAMRTQADSERFAALMHSQEEFSQTVLDRMGSIERRVLASDDTSGIGREITKVQELASQLDTMRSLFGGAAAGAAAAAGHDSVQLVMLRAKIAEDQADREHQRQLERERWDIEKAERLASLTGRSRSADQIDAFLESVAPLGGLLVERYGPGATPEKRVEGEVAARQAVDAQPMTMVLPPQLPEGVYATNCPACGAQVFLLEGQEAFACPRCATVCGRVDKPEAGVLEGDVIRDGQMIAADPLFSGADGSAPVESFPL